MNTVYKTVRRLAILVAGSVLLVLGVLLLFLPGPGILLILAGLAVLALEFESVKKPLAKLRARLAAKRQHKDTSSGAA